MKIVGLISGGKDSIYNLMQCVNHGHEIVALANIYPEHNRNDDLNSFMYQTVGHEGVSLIAKSMNLPIFQKSTEGNINCSSLEYQLEQKSDFKKKDEVEDLYALLLEIKENLNFDGISVGAIESNYQRLRVEHVCNRLNLKCFSYLWKRNQYELLKEMLDNDMEIIIIKVAALGLLPEKNLGKVINYETLNYFELLKNKYGFNVCGEGGEYETFTLWCPLYKYRLEIKEYELKKDSSDNCVGYMLFKSIELENKS